MSKLENYEANKRANQAFNKILARPEGIFHCQYCFIPMTGTEWIKDKFRCFTCGNRYE